jgi:hypothetical protein
MSRNQDPLLFRRRNGNKIGRNNLMEMIFGRGAAICIFCRKQNKARGRGGGSQLCGGKNKILTGFRVFLL